jgi:hypothetical protein
MAFAAGFNNYHKKQKQKNVEVRANSLYNYEKYPRDHIIL